MVLGRCARMLRDWKLIQRSEDATRLKVWIEEFEERSASPPRLTWEPQQGQGTSASGSLTQLEDGNVTQLIDGRLDHWPGVAVNHVVKPMC
jgi:hypothetical protein